MDTCQFSFQDVFHGAQVLHVLVELHEVQDGVAAILNLHPHVSLSLGIISRVR